MIVFLVVEPVTSSVPVPVGSPTYTESFKEFQQVYEEYLLSKDRSVLL